MSLLIFIIFHCIHLFLFHFCLLCFITSCYFDNHSPFFSVSILSKHPGLELRGILELCGGAGGILLSSAWWLKCRALAWLPVTPWKGDLLVLCVEQKFQLSTPLMAGGGLWTPAMHTYSQGQWRFRLSTGPLLMKVGVYMFSKYFLSCWFFFPCPWARDSKLLLTDFCLNSLAILWCRLLQDPGDIKSKYYY